MGKSITAKGGKARSEKRDAGTVRVLRPEDLTGCESLNERVEQMVENRCEVFMHNVAFLCKKHNLSQAQLCATKLENYISPPQLTGYKKRGRDIPLRVMALVAGAFDLTVEEMCGQLLDGVAEDADENAAPAGRPLDEYLKYRGTYDMTYFDTSKQLGKNTGPTANRMARTVMTIYPTYNALGTASFHVTAIFNCTPEERRKIAGYMAGMDLSHDASAVRAYYEKVLSGAQERDSAASRLKCLYDGDIHLTDRMTEITLRQVRGNDVVHMLAHNRAANSSEGKEYRGGLVTMMSTSRGAEHMPCVQAGLLIRGKEARGENGRATAQKCPLDFIQPEALAKELYLAPPAIELGGELEPITEYMKALFAGGEDGPFAKLSDADKKFCLETYLEKKLTETLRRNILSYYKLSLEMDSEVYALIRQTR